MIKKCIALVGATGSGKTRLAVEYAKANSAIVLRASDIIRKEMTENGLEISGLSMRSYAQTQMRLHGATYWSEKIISSIDQNTVVDELIVDGVRNIGGIEGLRKGVCELIVVALLVDEKTRVDRVIKRGRALDNIPVKELKKLMQDEFKEGETWELELTECIKRADIKIDASIHFNEVLRTFTEMIHILKK